MRNLASTKIVTVVSNKMVPVKIYEYFERRGIFYIQWNALADRHVATWDKSPQTSRLQKTVGDLSLCFQLLHSGDLSQY